MTDVPKGMTPQKLRDIACWLDVYDRLAATFVDNVEHAGWESTEDLAEIRLTINSKEVQDELRQWASDLDWADV